jgi:hypothetical protein
MAWERSNQVRQYLKTRDVRINTFPFRLNTRSPPQARTQQIRRPKLEELLRHFEEELVVSVIMLIFREDSSHDFAFCTACDLGTCKYRMLSKSTTYCE